MSTLGKLAATPESAVLAGTLAEQLPTVGTAKRPGGHAIIVGEPRLATLVVTGAIPVETLAVFRANQGAGADWATIALIRLSGGFAILVEQTGLAFGKSGAAPERTFLPNDSAHGLVTVGAVVLPRRSGGLTGRRCLRDIA